MTETKTTLSGKTLGLKTLSLGSKGTLNKNKIQVEVRKKRTITPQASQNQPLSEEASQKLRLLREAQKQAAQVQETPVQAAPKKMTPVSTKSSEEKPSEEIQVQPEESVSKEIQQRYTTEIEVPVSKKKQAEKEYLKEKQPNKKSLYTERRSSGKVNLNALSSEDDDDDEGFQGRRRSLASIRRAREKERLKHQEQLKSNEKVVREVVIPDTISVQELASRMSEKGANVVKELMKLGMMVTVTQTIDADTAQIVAEELGHQVKRVSDSDIEEVLKHEIDPNDLAARPPVVTVMGHVDHGKTSLLDALRQTHVASTESGGITQHIGAYQVSVPGGKKITFIDTPGHEAFTAMRARGAKATDIVVLVVAANDSVMPQTIEAINHAKAAGVPIVVAINKMDVPGANPDKVRMDLLQHEVVVESMGGEVLDVEVSAKEKRNLDKLLEAILLQAEVLDLKAPYHCPAEGVVIEAKMDKGRGSVATVLIQKGCLKISDVFVVGQHWGRVRSLYDDKGKKVKEATVSTPIEVVGLQGTPSAGDDFIVVEDETKAREIAGYRERKAREALQVKRRTTSENLLSQIKAGEIKELPVIMKADVQGSLEALQGLLSKIANNEVRIRILHTAVGGINETDVTLARASKAIIIGFNVRANPGARELARRDGIDIRYYSIIYDVADDMKKAVEGLLSPELREKILGYAEIRQVISISKVGKVAGCMVTEGLVKRNEHVRILRDDTVIFEGTLKQLKRFKDDVKEVKEGFECGMSFENFDDIKVGDRVESYEIEKIAVTLDMKH